MDRASIIKDAIDYIEELHKQERRIRTEISDLEFGRSKKNTHFELDEDESCLDLKHKRSRTLYGYDSSGSTTTSFNSPLEVPTRPYFYSLYIHILSLIPFLFSNCS